jgi:hypothetical protein
MVVVGSPAASGLSLVVVRACHISAFWGRPFLPPSKLSGAVFSISQTHF